MKKFLALLLACSLLLGLGVTALAEETVELSLYGPETGAALTDGEQDNLVMKHIEETLGIKINFDAHPDDAKFNAMLASGDLPDLMNFGTNGGRSSASNLALLVDGDMVYNLDDYMELMPNLALQENVVNFCRDVYGNGEKLWTVQGYVDPAPVKSFDTGIGCLVRWDYYAELGYPEINSGDDWLDVVEQMLAAHPTTDAGETRYGFAPFFEWGYISHWGGVVNALAGKSVAAGYGSGFQEINMIDETVYNGIMDKSSSYWVTAEFLTKANQRGLLDPDTFTNKWENVIAKTSADRVLSSCWDWAYGTANAALKDEGKGYGLVRLNAEGFAEGTASPMGCSPRLWVIPTTCRNPEAAAKFIDYVYSYEGARTIACGLRGEHWIETEEGKLLVPASVIEDQQSDPDWSMKVGTVYGNYLGLGGNTIDPKYNQKIGLSDPSDREYVPELNPFEKAYCEYYGISLMSERYTNLKYCTFDGTIASLLPVAPEEIQDIDAKINEYLNVEVVNLITSKTMDEFYEGQQRIIDACVEKGLEESEAFWHAAWTEAVAKAQSYR